MSPIARAIATLGLAGFALASNASTVTVFSDDFTHRDARGVTDYQLADTSDPTTASTQPGDYAVVANPGTAFGSHFNSYFDHTSGNATGAMLFFDGGSADVALWRASIPVMAGVFYQFSYWMSAATTTGSPSNPPVLQVLDGFRTQTTTSNRVGEWVQFMTTFSSGYDENVDLRIFDVNGDPRGLGNDGAIDDILLTFDKPEAVNPIPEPNQAALMAGGFALLAWMLRKRVTQGPPMMG